MGGFKRKITGPINRVSSIAMFDYWRVTYIKEVTHLKTPELPRALLAPMMPKRSKGSSPPIAASNTSDTQANDTVVS